MAESCSFCREGFALVWKRTLEFCLFHGYHGKVHHVVVVDYMESGEKDGQGIIASFQPLSYEVG